MRKPTETYTVPQTGHYERVYLAGPYRNNPEANIKTAARVARRLWQMAYNVFCPHLNCARMEDLGPETAEDIRREMLAWIPYCSTMVLLPGWEDSPGTLAELEWAKALGLSIVTWSDDRGLLGGAWTTEELRQRGNSY